MNTGAGSAASIASKRSRSACSAPLNMPVLITELIDRQLGGRNSRAVSSCRLDKPVHAAQARGQPPVKRESLWIGRERLKECALLRRQPGFFKRIAEMSPIVINFSRHQI